MLLDDINDVDMSLAKSNDVFKYLFEIQNYKPFPKKKVKPNWNFGK